MKKNKGDLLLEAVVNLFASLPRGRVLDLGCGEGHYSKRLKDLGFDVVASDMNYDNFKYHNVITFYKNNVEKELPFDEEKFDYVLFLETIEHIYNPDFAIGQIKRVLKSGSGVLILSTPNILNINSRIRFLFQGNFDFFREPILDSYKVLPNALQDLHLIPWKYQELEYLLFKNDLIVENIYTDLMKPTLKFYWLILAPAIKFALWQKERRAAKKGGVIDFKRINKILMSKELLFGRHLIIKAKKVNNK